MVGAGPVVGLVTPTAAAAATHNQTATKTVSLNHSNITPAVGCIGHSVAKNSTSAVYISAWHTASTGCVGGVSGGTFSPVPNTSMRTRIYTIKGSTKTRVFESFAHSTPGSSFYRQEVHETFGGTTQQVCVAIVRTAHRSQPIYAPVCVSFPS